MTTDHDPVLTALLLRLRRTLAHGTPVNPDGPEAADVVERLNAFLAAARSQKAEDYLAQKPVPPAPTPGRLHRAAMAAHLRVLIDQENAASDACVNGPRDHVFRTRNAWHRARNARFLWLDTYSSELVEALLSD